jgi:hypothetical protein
MIPKIKPPSGGSSGNAAGPWGKPAPGAPAASEEDAPFDPGHRRWFSRGTLGSILFAILLIALWGGHAWQDLSQPAAWTYWTDRYVSPSLTSSTGAIEANGRTRRVLAIKGPIGAAAATWFRERLDEAKLASGDIVLLSSPGGRLDQGLIMGEVIRARSLTTMVGTLDGEGRVRSSYCASACVLVYAGGAVREAFPGSALGVHQFTTDIAQDDSRRDIVADTQRTTGMIFEYITRMGVSPAILQAMSASREMRWLKESEALDLKLSTQRFAAN